MLVAVLIVSSACGPKRIKKRPVPRAQQIQAIRLMAEGDALLQEDKDHLAMLKYLEASQRDPYFEVVFNKLAVSYSRLQRYFEARRAVDRAIGLNPEYPYAFNTKGIVELAERDSKAASRAFSEAIKLAPDIANFYINLGYSYIQRGKYEEALSAYRKALELNPEIFSAGSFIELSFSGESVLDPRKYFELAKVFAQLGNVENCIKYLEKAISAGLGDLREIKQEPLFKRLEQEPAYKDFLRVYGIE